MKRNLIICFVIVLLSCFFFVGFANEVNAEEIPNEEATEEIEGEEEIIPEPDVENSEEVVEPEMPTEPEIEVLPETEVEDNPSFREMFDDFANKWLVVILATFGGAFGSGLAMSIARKVLQKIIESLKKSTEINESGNETLKGVHNTVVNGLEAIDNKLGEFEEKYATNFDETSKKIVDCIDEIDVLKDKIDFLKGENKTFKELIALLVSSDTKLSSNGYATKILDLLDEGSESDEQK